MKIYTGYFAKIGLYPHPISIARYKPKWLGDIAEYLQLAPTTNLLASYRRHIRLLQEEDNYYMSQEDIEAEYEKRFNLENLSIGAEKIHEWLEQLANKDPEITLLCYEKPGEFCHRHIVAEFLRITGYDVGGEYET